MERPTPMQISALRALHQYHRERGTWPRSADWAAWRNTVHPEAPSQDQISRAWHTWLQALAVAGAPWDLLVTRGLNRWDRAHLPQALAAIPWDQFPDDVRPPHPESLPTPTPSTIATRQMLGPEEVRAMESTWALVWSTLDRTTRWTWFRDSPAHPSSAWARFPTSWAARIRRAMQQNPRVWMAYIHPTWLDAMARTSEQRWPDLSNALAWWSTEHWPSALCYLLALYRIRSDADELTVLHWLETHALAHPTAQLRASYRFSRRFSMPRLATPPVRPMQRPDGRRPMIIVVGQATHRGFCRQLVEREFGCRLRFYEGQDSHTPKRFPHADGVILAIDQTSHEFDDKLHHQFAAVPRGFFLTIPQGGQANCAKRCRRGRDISKSEEGCVMAPRKFTRPDPDPLNPVPIPDSLLALMHDALNEAGPADTDSRPAPPLAPIASMAAAHTPNRAGKREPVPHPAPTEQDAPPTETVRSDHRLVSRRTPAGEDSCEAISPRYQAVQEAFEAFERLTPTDPPSQYLRVFAQWNALFPPQAMDPERLLAWCQLWPYDPEVVTRWLALAEWVQTLRAKIPPRDETNPTRGDSA